MRTKSFVQKGESAEMESVVVLLSLTKACERDTIGKPNTNVESRVAWAKRDSFVEPNGPLCTVFTDQ